MSPPENNVNVEKLVEDFDLLLDSHSSSIDSTEIERLSDQEMLELNRRLSCLNLLDAARPKGLETTQATNKTRAEANQREASTLKSFPPAEPENARYIGDYRIDRLLGQGGYGQVFLGFDKQLERHVAIKVPHGLHLNDAGQRKRFQREAKAAAMLSHPNIIPLYQSSATESEVFLAYGFAEGPSLSEWLASPTQPPNPNLAAKIARVLAEAIQYAHSRGVVHRDLKPANLLFSKPISDVNEQEFVSRICIADFGLAKFSDHNPTLTNTGDILGTPAYMSPEQAKGDSSISDERSDIYSLGSILFELLTGQPPFRKDNPILTLMAIETEPVSWTAAASNIPKDLKAICLKCLEKKPDARYQTAQHLAEDLQRFLNGETISARTPTWHEQLQKWFQRNPRIGTLSIALAASLLIGLIGTTFFAFRSSGNAAIAKSNESRWKQEAKQLAESEGRLKRQKRKVETLLSRARRTNYALQVSAAFNLSLKGLPISAMEILETSPLSYRDLEHDLVYSITKHGVDSVEVGSGRVSCCAFSPSNQKIYIAVGSKIRCLDITSRIQTSEFDSIPKIAGIVVRSDGKQIAVHDHQGTIIIHDPSGRQVAKRTGQWPIAHLAFPATEPHLLIAERATANSTLVSWNFAQKTEEEILFRSSSPLTDFKLSDDGKQLAITDTSRLVLFNYPSVEKVFETNFDYPQSICFLPKRARILLAHSDRSIAQVDIHTGKLLSDGVAHNHTALTRSTPSPNRIYSFTDRGDLRFWDSNGQQMCLDINLGGPLVDLFFDDESKTLIAVTGDKIKFFDYKNAYPHAVIPTSGATKKVEFATNGTNLWAVCEGTRSDQESRLVQIRINESVESNAFSIPRFLLFDLSCERAQFLKPTDTGHVQLDGEIADVSERISNLKNLDSTIPEFWNVLFDPNRNRIYACDRGGMIYFDIASDGQLGARKAMKFPGQDELGPNETICSSVGVSNDGQTVAAGYTNGTVVLFDAATGETKHALDLSSTDWRKPVLSKIEFSRDDRYLLASVSARGTTVFDLRNGYQPILKMGSGGRTACFSRDGHYVAASTGSQLKFAIEVFELESREKRYTLQGHRRPINDLQFSHDSRWLASGSSRLIHSCRVWSLEAIKARKSERPE